MVYISHHLKNHGMATMYVAVCTDLVIFSYSYVYQGWRKVVNSWGLISQQEKFSMVKIKSYEGLLK